MHRLNRFVSKRLIRTVVPLLAAVLATGCWSAKEINELAFITLIGVDKGEKERFLVTAQIAKPRMLAAGQPGGGAGEEPPFFLVTSEGRTLFEATRRMVEKVPRRPFFGHIQGIVIGEPLAREGIAPALDFFQRQRQIRRTTRIYIAQGEAQEILAAQPKIEPLTGVAIQTLAIQSVAISTSAPIFLGDFVSIIGSVGRDAFAPRLQRVPAAELKKIRPSPQAEGQGAQTQTAGASPPPSQGGGDSSGGQAGGQKQDEKSEVRLSGLAVFHLDKLVGWFNPSETRGFLWTLNLVDRGFATVKNPADDRADISLEILRANGQIIPEVDGTGNIRMKVRVNVLEDLAENTSLETVTEPQLMRQVEQRAADLIRSEVIAAVRKAQEEFGADVFGFGDAVARSHPELWNRISPRWREIFPTVAVESEVYVTVRRPGLIVRPVQVHRDGEGSGGP